MARKALLAAVAVAVLMSCGQKRQQDEARVANLPEKEIRDLSYAIKSPESYRADVRHQLDSMELKVAGEQSVRKKYETTLELATRFRPINTDSSLYYAHNALALSRELPKTFSQRAEIAIIDALATAGLFTGAVEFFREVGEELLPSEKVAYWEAGRRLYAYMASYSQGNTFSFQLYDRYYQQYDDSLLSALPRDCNLRTFLVGERMVREGRYHEARERLEKLVNTLPEESNLYGMAAFQLAEVWRSLGNEANYAAWLAKSALSDVKGCVTEGLALPTLAYWLYEQGELSEAFAFINFALGEASSGNARMRAVTIARFVPIIDKAYRDKINSSRDELMIYFVLVTLLLIITALLIIFFIKQNRLARANAEKLAVTTKRQESYIGNFIGLYSSYADKLNHFSKAVATKLAAGEVQELKKLIDSGKFTDQDNDDIHKIFDAAFLDIYPDFVANINSLLKPEEAIAVKGLDMLTPELRIYAFVKLGVEESSRIAQILHYSINTVYTYRNKMRNRALSRDTFDEDVKSL